MRVKWCDDLQGRILWINSSCVSDSMSFLIQSSYKLFDLNNYFPNVTKVYNLNFDKKLSNNSSRKLKFFHNCN